MRVAILTSPLNNRNYGTILQAYALQTVLKRKGCEAVVIARPKTVFEMRMKKKYAIMGRYIQPFIDNHLTQIKVKSLFHLNTSNFDAVIVGSDQVWRGRFERNITNMFLDFVPKGSKCKKIAYAASFGISYWDFSPNRTAKIAALAKQFDAISVREDSGVTLCRTYLGVNAIHVLDPTMLMIAQDYIENIRIVDIPLSKGNLLVYLLDMSKDKKAVVDKVALNGNYTPFLVNNAQTGNTKLPIKKRISLPVERWLRGYFDAKFVVTDSFHGCVFSIIFNKPFIAYGNEFRGMTRFMSLLRMFGLENQLIFSSKELMAQIETVIDWGEVNKKMQNLKNMSETFLDRALKFEENEINSMMWKGLKV